ncbi:MAG: hypothetical protein ACJ79S_02860 [Gemmatimonadaceae bacterium]
MSLGAAALVAGSLYTLATRGLGFLGPAPLVVRVLFPAGMVWVAWTWASYATRLHAVLRAREGEVTVERPYPPLTRTYPWSEVREWRLAAPARRGMATLRLTFADGERVTLYPAAFENADRLQSRLEALLPACGTRVRVGRRAE